MPQTRDRGYFAPEKISPRQSMTPEGFLLCEAVPIARTGELLYAEGELVDDEGEPLIRAGSDAAIRVSRDADVVFAPETIASFEGKPVTISHPDEFVSPENWRSLTVGSVMNVRQGDGIEDDLLLADLLITDADAIKEVRSGLREVSCGYEADVDEIEPGKGRQTNIVGNHVALVERGRCGPRCAIGDTMKPKKRTVFDRLMAAFRAKDEEAFKAELEEAKDELEEGKKDPEGKDPVKDAPTDLESRIAALESAIQKLVAAKSADEDPEAPEKAGPVEDAEDEPCEPAKVGDAMARAEVLAPGIKAPAKPTTKALDSLKAEALAKADAAVVAPFGDVRSLKGAALDAVFVGASELAKARNNQGAKPGSAPVKDARMVDSIANINAKNRAFWSNR